MSVVWWVKVPVKKETFAKRKSPVERKEDQRSESTETGREKDESLIDVLNKNTAYNIEWKMCKETLKGHVIISDLL